jgi:predicted TIM-barrel fold metal-dependent hydrolase
VGLIDVHEHLESRRELPAVLAAMDATNVERAVLLGSSARTLTGQRRAGFTGHEENNLELLAAARAHPDRIEAWPTIRPLDRGKLARLRAYHELGATGLKLYLGHGALAAGSAEYVFGEMAMDDPRMDEVYAYCASHRLPVCLHVNPGPAAPGFADEFVAVLERHPRMLVNAPHWLLSSGRPERLAEFLTAFPNLVTDVSFGADEYLLAGIRRISRDPLALRRVVEQHPGRFLFGADLVVTAAAHKTPAWIRTRLESYLAMLGSREYVSPLAPAEVLRGLDLPTATLERIGRSNYLTWRASDRPPAVASRELDWTRLRVPRPPRAPGQRLPPDWPTDRAGAVL